MLRLFVGIALPPEHRLALSTICLGLRSAKWVDPGNYHVTLRFIGEVDEGTAADIDEALAGVQGRRFDLTIEGVGCFSNGGTPRTLYAGIGRAPALVQLQQRVESAIVRAGIPPDGRRFTPHVTLARFQRGNPDEVGRFLVEHNLLHLPAFPVRHFQLVASYLTKAGSIYEDQAEYPLS